MQEFEGCNNVCSFMGVMTFSQFLHALGLGVLNTSGWCK